MLNEYEFSRASGKCAATDRPFAEGEAYYAVLVEQPDGFVRRDYALDAWTGPPEGCFCFWRGRMPVKDRRTHIAIDHGILLHLFQRMENAESQPQQHFRFVLALLLMRKRLLRFEQAVHEEGREYWQMRVTSDHSVHRVLNPSLTDDEVAALSAQLTALLSGEVEAIQQLEVDAIPENQAEGAARLDTE